MNVAQIREATRLTEDAGATDFVTLLELGGPGCQLRLADATSSMNIRREWLIDKTGTSKERPV